MATTLPLDDGERALSSPHPDPLAFVPVLAEAPPATVDGMLWLQFHTAVTLTPYELSALLDAPRRGPWSGMDEPLTREVLRLLTTDRDCLTADDIRTMRLVVDRIKVLRADLDRGDERARERLVALGHDPDKRER